MEKMYSKQDVVRLVALERDRCINEVYGRIKEVERLGRTKPGLKVWTRRVVDALEKVLLKVVNGKMVKGVYEEQLALVLLDRHKKLNARFPSPQNEKMITGLEMFLEACKERVQGRMERGVMGKLEK